jgi:hypothetical protein
MREFMNDSGWRHKAREGMPAAILRYARRGWVDVLEDCLDELGFHPDQH